VVEALNVAALAGTALASIAYFYANRLVPIAQAGRSQIEIHAFLWVWAATLLHALLRPRARAWVEQLAMTALLCVGLPLLNAVTTGQHLGVYLVAGDLQRAGVELVSLVFGVAFAYAAYRAHRSAVRPVPTRARRGATAAVDVL
jgi:hypothetical protein